MNRHACLKDLDGYLKRFDYLKDFTEVEQYQIRQNIGAISKEDLLNMERMESYYECDYETFYRMIQNKELTIGTLYIVKDFQSIYESNTGQVWGDTVNPSKIFTLVITAIAADKIDPNVIILSKDYPESYKWTVKYDPTQEILKETVKTKGKIIYMQDNNNNSAYYDFKNIKSRRTVEQLKSIGINSAVSLDLYTFNTQDFREASETFNVQSNHFELGAKDNVFIGNSCKYNNFGAGFVNNTFVDKCENNRFLSDTYNNTFKEAVIYLTGRFNNLILTELTDLDIEKSINKIDQGYALSYLDQDTLALQVHKL